MDNVNPQNMTPEQIKELEEKLKSMSPEELREFQKKQCIFCHIVSGKVQAKKIYEDSKVIAILDINPANPGHILLLPKEHYAIMPQLPEDELKHIFVIAKYLSNVLLREIEATGTNIVVANGPAAGQKAQHFMIHIIPRKEDDKIRFNLPQNPLDDNELEQIRVKLEKKIAEMTGTKKKVVEKVPIIPPIRAIRETKKKETKKIKKNTIEKTDEREISKKEISGVDKDKLDQQSKSEGIDLDDIAKILGGG